MRNFAKMIAKKASKLGKMIDTPATKESLTTGIHSGRHKGNKITKAERTPQKDTVEHKHNPIIKDMVGKMKGKGEAKSGKYAGMNAAEKAKFKGASKAKKAKRDYHQEYKSSLSREGQIALRKKNTEKNGRDIYGRDISHLKKSKKSDKDKAIKKAHDKREGENKAMGYSGYDEY